MGSLFRDTLYSSKAGGRHSSVGVISGVVAVIVVIILSSLVFCYVRKRR